jgi:hypothetical protein
MNKKYLVLSLGSLATILFLIGFITQGAKTAPNLAENDYPHWLASPTLQDCSTPQDGNGNYWYEVGFDDSQWTFVSLPATNDIGTGETRFYRTIFTAPASGATYLHLASDDGIWIYINGSSIGHWGGGCHQAGCVGDTPWTCGIHETFNPIDISSYLNPSEDNVIAVQVSNQTSEASSSYFFLSLYPENQYPETQVSQPLIFNLPIGYNGREYYYRNGYYYRLQSSLTAVFDHAYATGDLLQPFIDESFTSLGEDNCTDGINCFDSNLTWNFRVNDVTEAVYPVADGEIITGKSGCLTGDDLGCRVCIQHGDSGYSTLYSQLIDDENLVTSGAIYWDEIIGYMSQITGTTQYKMNFATFYDHVSNCTPGKQVDPSGWSSISSTDPYQAAAGLFSSHLWVHPFSINTTILADASNSLLWEDLITSVEFASGTYSETLHVTLAPAPDPNLTNFYTSPGSTFYFLSTDLSGNKVTEAAASMLIETEYDTSDFGDIFPGSLGIYQFDASTHEWNLLPTTLGTFTATATTQTIAPFAVLGEKSYTLTIGIVGSGSVTPPITGPFHYGDEVQLTATGNPGWAFSDWSGDLISTTNPVTITIHGDKAITATFTQIPYDIDITKVGDGQVDQDPAGPYYYGDLVQLTATADPHWAFSDWSGDLISTTNPVTITIDGDKAITATFSQIPYDIDITKVGDGQVDQDPAGPYYFGDQVQLTAIPSVGWLFSDWSGDVITTTNPVTITIDSSKTITATFQEGLVTYIPITHNESP